jgi:hypothetical protein
VLLSGLVYIEPDYGILFAFSWSLKDKAAPFPPGALCLGRRARGRGVSGPSPLLGAGDDIDGTRSGLPGVLGPDTNEPSDRSG